MSAHDHLSQQQFPIDRLMRAYSTEYEGTVGEIGEHLDQGRIQAYTKRDTTPPPIHLTQGDDEEYLVNGHHRVHAAARRGATSLSGYLHPMDEDGDYPTLRPEHLR